MVNDLRFFDADAGGVLTPNPSPKGEGGGSFR
jgi:hypothetical protein